MREALFTACFGVDQVSFNIMSRGSLPLTHLHLKSPAALHGAPHAVVGCATVDAIVTVFHAQDGEELPVLANAVPGVKEPAGHRQQWQVRTSSVMFFGYD